MPAEPGGHLLDVGRGGDAGGLREQRPAGRRGLRADTVNVGVTSPPIRAKVCVRPPGTRCRPARSVARRNRPSIAWWVPQGTHHGARSSSTRGVVAPERSDFDMRLVVTHRIVDRLGPPPRPGRRARGPARATARWWPRGRPVTPAPGPPAGLPRLTAGAGEGAPLRLMTLTRSPASMAARTALAPPSSRRARAASAVPGPASCTPTSSTWHAAQVGCGRSAGAGPRAVGPGPSRGPVAVLRSVGVMAPSRSSAGWSARRGGGSAR